ncbi:MAG: protein-L-isoaspartate(D-aspartate) O-methyltransferase, partial [bacterium]|nr:protein-L-isoaspartate(D-aspartate) O-methyltransferase [bacterium]
YPVQKDLQKIKDPRVIAALKKVPRQLFMPDAFKFRAYEDNAQAIGEGQTISQPYIVALMSQALELKGTEKVLELGTGSGYQAAVLAELASRVFTVERIDKLSRGAEDVIRTLKYHNILFHIGDGTLGWPKFAPYDRIIVTAGAPEVPKACWEQLAEGGRMVIPVGDRNTQKLLLIDKVNGKEVRKELSGCMFVPLVGKYGWQANGQ